MDGPDTHAYDECHYEEYRSRVAAFDGEHGSDGEHEADAYEPNDPKSDNFYERMVAVEDLYD